MSEERPPAPAAMSEKPDHTFTVATRALRLTAEVQLAPTDQPTHEEATNIVMDALGGITLEAVSGQIQHVDYKPGDHRPASIAALPFPGDASPVELPASEEFSVREKAQAERFGLSKREMQVLRLVAYGQKNATIGRTLFLSEDTVKTYLRTAYRKLGANDRAHAVGILNNLVPRPPKKPEPKKRKPARKESELDQY